MARITVEDCLDKVDSRFALVILVAKRAKQLIKGDDCTIHAPGNKYVVSALREVAAGHVTYDSRSSDMAMLNEIERELTK